MSAKPKTEVTAGARQHAGQSGPLKADASIEEIDLALNFLFAVEEGQHCIGRGAPESQCSSKYPIQPLGLRLRVQEYPDSNLAINLDCRPNSSFESLTEQEQNQRINANLYHEIFRSGIVIGNVNSALGFANRSAQTVNHLSDFMLDGAHGLAAIFSSKKELIDSINSVANGLGRITSLRPGSADYSTLSGRTILIDMLDAFQRTKAAEKPDILR